jgi:hypothetical protein
MCPSDSVRHHIESNGSVSAMPFEGGSHGQADQHWDLMKMAQVLKTRARQDVEEDPTSNFRANLTLASSRITFSTITETAATILTNDEYVR